MCCLLAQHSSRTGRYLQIIRKRIVDLISQNVCFSILKLDDKKYYVEEGYGGKGIEAWPVFHFFKDYVSGDKKKAVHDFEAWYYEQFWKYHKTPKNLGGLYKGSLYKLIVNKHKERGVDWDGTLSKADPAIVEEGIKERVKQRFMVVDSIMCQGYNKKTTERIIGVRKNGYVYLKGGHHRWAILQLLGHQYLPNVLIIPGETIYNFIFSK